MAFCLYLPPVLKEVLPEDRLGGVLVVQHLGEEHCHLLGCQAQLHLLTCTDTNTSTSLETLLLTRRTCLQEVRQNQNNQNKTQCSLCTRLNSSCSHLPEFGETPASTSAPSQTWQANPYIYRWAVLETRTQIYIQPLDYQRATNKHKHAQELTDQTNFPQDTVVPRLLNKEKTITVINQCLTRHTFGVLKSRRACLVCLNNRVCATFIEFF